MSGKCKRTEGMEPAEWERQHSRQFGKTLQLSPTVHSPRASLTRAHARTQALHEDVHTHTYCTGPTLQLSCDPANAVTGFIAAMGGCPEAFRMVSWADGGGVMGTVTVTMIGDGGCDRGGGSDGGGDAY